MAFLEHPVDKGRDKRCEHGYELNRRACVSGVYAIDGPNGIYVGSSRCCYARNLKETMLGLDWIVIREMPDATQKELRKAETQTADMLELRGFTIVTRNTSKIASSTRRAAWRPEFIKAAQAYWTPELRRQSTLEQLSRLSEEEKIFRSKMLRLGLNKYWSTVTKEQREEKGRRISEGRRRGIQRKRLALQTFSSEVS